eukprot:6206592-Pleurochrysis_carterae.AAC.1
MRVRAQLRLGGQLCRSHCADKTKAGRTALAHAYIQNRADQVFFERSVRSEMASPGVDRLASASWLPENALTRILWHGLCLDAFDWRLAVAQTTWLVYKLFQEGFVDVAAMNIHTDAFHGYGI